MRPPPSLEPLEGRVLPSGVDANPWGFGQALPERFSDVPGHDTVVSWPRVSGFHPETAEARQGPFAVGAKDAWLSETLVLPGGNSPSTLLPTGGGVSFALPGPGPSTPLVTWLARDGETISLASALDPGRLREFRAEFPEGPGTGEGIFYNWGGFRRAEGVSEELRQTASEVISLLAGVGASDLKKKDAPDTAATEREGPRRKETDMNGPALSLPGVPGATDLGLFREGLSPDDSLELPGILGWVDHTGETAAWVTDAAFLEGWTAGLPPPRAELVPLGDRDLSPVAAYLVGPPNPPREVAAAREDKVDLGLTDFVAGTRAPQIVEPDRRVSEARGERKPEVRVPLRAPTPEAPAPRLAKPDPGSHPRSGGEAPAGGDRGPSPPPAQAPAGPEPVPEPAPPPGEQGPGAE